MQRNDRSYKDLKQKQKSAIADKTYKMHLKFYLENQRMPDATEMNDICKSLFTADYFRWLYTAFTRATDILYLVNWPKEQIEEE